MTERAVFVDADIRGGSFRNTRMRGVEMIDVEITGEFRNLRLNGVDVAPLVEAELNRRMPERAKMRPETSEGFREAYAIVGRRWDETVERARRLPPEALHRGVGDEWSFIQTLRHLNFATAAWVNRMVLGELSPWHPLDLPWDEAPGWDGIPWDREAHPSLDAVLAVRQERQETVRGLLASLTEKTLADEVSRAAPGWPDYQNVPVAECLRIVLNEEWEHRLYAERDLDIVEKEIR